MTVGSEVCNVCDLIGATTVFPSRLDRALDRWGVGRLRRRGQQIGDASSSALASAFVFSKAMSFGILLTHI